MSITNKITIIIVLYNSSEIIFECLKTLKNFEIIIVDNGKNSTVLKRLRSMNNIKIVSPGKNIGMGYVPVALSKEGATFFVVIRNKQIKAQVVKLPFYKK